MEIMIKSPLTSSDGGQGTRNLKYVTKEGVAAHATPRRAPLQQQARINSENQRLMGRTNDSKRRAPISVYYTTSPEQESWTYPIRNVASSMAAVEDAGTLQHCSG